jgi:hypothetical protein
MLKSLLNRKNNAVSTVLSIINLPDYQLFNSAKALNQLRE